MTQDGKQFVDRDPYETPWHLLDIIDSRKVPHWDRELEWVLERNFPAQYFNEMSVVLRRALSVIGKDRVTLTSLLFDAQMLSSLIENQQPVKSHTHQFYLLQVHDTVKDRNLNWAKHFAAQSIVCLGNAMFMHVFGHPEGPDNVVEIDDRFETIDSEINDVFREIMSAAEFVTIAETWPNLGASSPDSEYEIQREVSGRISERSRKAANARHKPATLLKEECYEFYKAGNFRSYRDAARNFLDQLTRQKLSIFSEANAEKILAEFIGKRIKMDKK